MGILKPAIVGWKRITEILSALYVRSSAAVERIIYDSDGYLYQIGTKITSNATVLNGAAADYANRAVTTLSGGSGQKACNVNGLSIITGGTGIADMTLAAPTDGARAVIRIGSLSSGSVVVKTPAGVTFDGTNNTATFDAANEALVLKYNAATAWAIELNIGAVALSST